MIIVTGGAGFIGSNLVRGLNRRGEDEILVVDDLADSSKVANLRGCRFVDYMDREEFLAAAGSGGLLPPRCIFHQGACSDTMEGDGRFMMDVNYAYSKKLLQYAVENAVPFVYASSASVYGGGQVFAEDEGNEDALNVYAFSKLQFDRYVRRMTTQTGSQIVGLRYFNVYGPRERHKGRMASVARHFYRQYREHGRIELFVGSGGYRDGAQERDFVWVGDVVEVNLYFMDHPDVSGIFNVGTGASRSFNDVALAVIGACEEAPMSLDEAVSSGRIRYIPFPEGLRERYQSYTRADTGKLRTAGYDADFVALENGIREYIEQLKEES